MRFVPSLAAAATTPVALDPVTWDFLGYSYHPGPVFTAVLAVAITRAIVSLQTKGRQIVLDALVSMLCALVAALWTQAHDLDLLAAGVAGIGTAATGVGLIGMAKGQVAAGIRAGLQTMLKAWAAPPDKPNTWKEHSMVTEPAWLRAARAKLGTREAAGPANNSTIMSWAKRLGTKVLGMVYNSDATPWCGVFCAVCIAEAGLLPAPIAVRAKSWATWGNALPAATLAPGAVLVFERPGGGHVGFYVGEDALRYRVLGGNQGDRVSEVWIEKSRCVARRWPIGIPFRPEPVRLASNGEAASRDEA